MAEEESRIRTKKTAKGPRSVAELAAGVLQPLVARRAAMNVGLVMSWAEIAGVEHASFTFPEKIDWPRQRSEDEAFQPGALILRCEGARAILVQHEVPQLIERVNLYFGFHAIERIRIVQGPVRSVHASLSRDTLPAPRRNLDPEALSRLARILETVTDPALRESLEKLGRGILQRQGRHRGRVS